VLIVTNVTHGLRAKNGWLVFLVALLGTLAVIPAGGARGIVPAVTARLSTSAATAHGTSPNKKAAHSCVGACPTTAMKLPSSIVFRLAP
jgi:hypothetical protein